MKRFFGFLVAVTLLVGCQNNTKSVPFNASKTGQSNRMTATNFETTPENTDNPYDTVGYWHNRILEAAHGFIRKNGDTSNAGIQFFIADYFRENRHKEVLEELKSIPENLPDLIISDYKKVVFAQPMAAITTTFLQQIFEAIRQGGEVSYNTFKANIMAIEHRILSNNGISKRDFAMLLSTTSLARYSGFYWNKVLDSHGNKPLAAKGSGFIRFLKRAAAFICTCTADASGAGYAYLRGRPDQTIADASYLSTITWGGLTYYNNW